MERQPFPSRNVVLEQCDRSSVEVQGSMIPVNRTLSCSTHGHTTCHIQLFLPRTFNSMEQSRSREANSRSAVQEFFPPLTEHDVSWRVYKTALLGS